MNLWCFKPLSFWSFASAATGWEYTSHLCIPRHCPLKKNNFICLFLAMLNLHCCAGFCLIAVRDGYFLGVVYWLTAVASFVVEHWLCGTQASVVVAQGSVAEAARLKSITSVIVVYGFSCSLACGIFSDRGSSLCFQHWQANSSSLSHQGSPSFAYFLMFCNCNSCLLSGFFWTLYCWL